MDEPVHRIPGSGSVVLDVGAGVGALVLFAPPELDGREIEVRRHGGTPAWRTHSQVRPRTADSQRQFAAVYPQLEAGTYTMWAGEGGPVMTVTVSGGRVATAWWPRDGTAALPGRRGR